MAQQWNHRLVRASQAWARMPQTAGGEIDWADVAVAHLDTGYSEHPCFGPWNGGLSTILQTAKAKSYVAPLNGAGRDPFIETGIQTPGHGTKTCSVIAGIEGTRFTGLAPQVPVIPFRVTDSSLVTSRVARAIGRALRNVADNKLAPVVSISLGYPLLSGSEMGRAVDHAYEKGVIIVAAGGQVIDRTTYPGKHLRTIGVGGITRYRAAGQWKHRIYAVYDSYSRIDSWAPAEPIGRATPHRDYSGVGNPADLYGSGDGSGDGTSYATAHVAAAAVLWCRFHGWAALRQTYGRGWDLVEAFRQCLFKSEQAFRMPANKQPQGARGKLLDIDKLLQVALPDPADLRKEADLAADDRM
ncbi:MAG: S8 family serine peptidase [Rhodovibrionaceae bacterium]